MKMNTSADDTTPANKSKAPKSGHKCSANCSCSTSQKRPMNAFLIFCKRNRSDVKQKNPHLENRSITKLLAELWATIDLEQKQKYTELARNYKEAFMKANPNFKWMKWYKTDIKSPPSMQPCSPPYVTSFQSSNTTTLTNLNCNSFDNNGGNSSTATNYLSESTPSVPKANGSSLTNQSDTAHISATNDSMKTNDKPADKCSSNSNLTPKPPKKRYLENGAQPIATPSSSSNHTATNLTINDCKIKKPPPAEAIISNIQTPPQPQPSPAPQHSSKSYAIGGPPVLDIETMNRVIENAFGASPSFDDKKSSYKMNKKTDSQLFSPTAINMTKFTRKSLSTKDCFRDEIRGDKLNDLRCNEKFDESHEQIVKAITSASKAKEANDESRSNSPINNSSPIDKLVNSSLTSFAGNSDKDKLMHASTTLPKISSHLEEDEEIDDDKPLNLSSSTTTVKGPTNQVLIDNLIEKFLNDSSAEQGNPMPIEMLQNSSIDYTSNSSTSSLSKSQQQNQQRKERSCKGKRYLEMLSETKLTKRSKNASTSSISNGDESNSNKSANYQNNSSTSGSKWVSCGFDLEEHIAALPQLVGDNHLINAMDSTKSNDTSPESQNNILLNNHEHNLAKKDTATSSISNTTMTGKHSSVDYMDTTSANNENNRQVDLAEKIVERLNINSQSLNECDKLNTLAEIALQQAHRQPSSISPSCT